MAAALGGQRGRGRGRGGAPGRGRGGVNPQGQGMLNPPGQGAGNPRPQNQQGAGNQGAGNQGGGGGGKAGIGGAALPGPGGRQLAARVSSGAITQQQAQKTMSQRQTLAKALGPDWRSKLSVGGKSFAQVNAGLKKNPGNAKLAALRKKLVANRSSVLEGARTKGGSGGGKGGKGGQGGGDGEGQN